jgi:hypothetical protein
MSHAILVRLLVAIAIFGGLADCAPTQAASDFPFIGDPTCEASDCLWLTVDTGNGGGNSSLYTVSEMDEEQGVPLTITWSHIFGPNLDSGPPVSVGMLDADGTVSDLLYLDTTDGNLHFWSKDEHGLPAPLITPAVTVFETGSPQLVAGPFDVPAGRVGVWAESKVEVIPEPGIWVLVLSGVSLAGLRLWRQATRLASAGST